MGYHMSQVRSEFFIAAADMHKVLTAVQGLYGRESISDGSGRHFSWVPHDFHKINDPWQILRAWRWSPELDENMNVVDLGFTGEKLGDEEILFDAIAPYVKKGSFIEMSGEEGERWRWVFDGKTHQESHPTITWGG